MNSKSKEVKPAIRNGEDLCDWSWYKMDLAIRRKDLALVKFVAEEDFLDLAELWLWAAQHAIYWNFIELLNYLQKELKVDFSEKVRALSAEDRQLLRLSVRTAAEHGNAEIVEFAISEFKIPEIFNAAFIGAAEGGQIFLLLRLRRCGFEIGSELASRAMEACLKHSEKVVRQIALSAGDAFVLEKNEAGDGPLSQAEKIVRTLADYRE